MTPESATLSAGSIAGIVIGVIAFVAICVFGVVYFFFRYEVRNLQNNQQHFYELQYIYELIY